MIKKSITIVAILLISVLAASGFKTLADTSDGNDSTALANAAPSEYVEVPTDLSTIEFTAEEIPDVTEEAIEKELDVYKGYTRVLEEVTDRDNVEAGDVVNIDYTGKVGGNAFEGGSASGCDLEIGSGQFIDGFEDGLIGAQKGSTIDVACTFPNEYFDNELAGKEAVYEVTVNKIQKYVTPEFTDEAVANIFRNLLDGYMQHAAQFFFFLGQRGHIVVVLACLDHIFEVVEDTPYTAQEAERTFYALIAPFKVAVNRSSEQDEESCRIRTIFANDFFRRNHVALGLTHLGAVFQDHALREQVGERFIKVYEASIMEHLGEETGVQEMQDSMLDTADVLVNRCPVVDFILGKGSLIIFRVGVAQVIPGGADKGVHGIRFALGIGTTLRTLAVDERFTRSQRRQSAAIE